MWPGFNSNSTSSRKPLLLALSGIISSLPHPEHTAYSSPYCLLHYMHVYLSIPFSSDVPEKTHQTHSVLAPDAQRRAWLLDRTQQVPSVLLRRKRSHGKDGVPCALVERVCE